MKKMLYLGLGLLSFLPLGATSESPAPGSVAVDKEDGLSSYKTADELWGHVDELKHNLERDLQGGDADVAKAAVLQMKEVLNSFTTKYPANPHIWEAKILQAQLGILSRKMELPGAPTFDQSMEPFEKMAKDKTAPKEVRAQAALTVISETFSAMQGTPAEWDAMDAKIESFQNDFGPIAMNGNTPGIVMMRAQELMLLKSSGNMDRYHALLKKLMSDKQPEVVVLANHEFAVQKKIEELKTKPIELKFTAVDGSEVDMAKLRGKVVLIDFWATWCGPCREEVPDVVAAYQKYHDQGFEVVGISLDQDRDRLLAFTKDNGMAWPQYFDGGGFENKISSGYGIDAIPTMWLIDKKGLLVQVDADPSAGAMIGDQVEKLLKAP